MGPKPLRHLLALTGLCAVACAGGCNIVGIFGGMAEAYKQQSTHEVKAEYAGLEGKSFAVVVAADRGIQAEQPDLVRYLTTKMTDRLADNKNVPRAGGFVPAEDVLTYTYQHPGWASKPMSELAKELGGVQRLVYIEIFEYRLREPGNQYEWDGAGGATVAVIETDSTVPEDYAFQKQITVTYPDKKGYGPADMTESAINTVLATRLIDRVTWLLYDHQEKYYPDY